MPFFSIVIPLYNKENHIQKTLESVLAQSFADFEIIIVDDGSTDASMEKAKSVVDNRIKYFSQENSGASQARNFGIEQANSAHIALLDADDVWEKNHLEEHYKSISKFPDSALYCNAYNLKLSGNFTHAATYNLSNPTEIQIVEDYFKASIIHPIAWTSAVAFKKEDFWEIGGFNTNILSGQDIDLWIRFGLKKVIVFNPTITTCYNKTIENSLSKRNFRESKHAFFHSYIEEERKNSSLKKYMDLNRYAVALHCKCHNDKKTFIKLKKDISANSLNYKQKFLFYSPFYLVKWLKKLHLFLIRKKIYITAFK